MPEALDVVFDVLASMGPADRDVVLCKLELLRTVVAAYPAGEIDPVDVFCAAVERLQEEGLLQ